MVSIDTLCRYSNCMIALANAVQNSFVSISKQAMALDMKHTTGVVVYDGHGNADARLRQLGKCFIGISTTEDAVCSKN